MQNKTQDYYAPSEKAGQTKNEKVLILTDNQVHDLEFFYPFYRLTEEGYQVDVVTPNGGEFAGKFGMKLSQSLKLTDVDASKYALLYIPGGKAPASLRKQKQAVALVKQFAQANKPIATICHGAELLVEADLVKGKNIAAWPEVKQEIEEKGGTYADKPYAMDGVFITSRWPGDLPTHMTQVLKALSGYAQSFKSRQAA